MSKYHLVIGVNGTIGSALYARLRAEGRYVRGTTQRRQLVQDKEIHYLNLLEPASWVIDYPVDVVYFCAGICNLTQCEEDPIGTANINIDATLALACQLAEQGAFIVYLSTNHVLSDKEACAKADAPYHAQNEYGKQKAIIEAKLQAAISNLAIVRLTKVILPNSPLIQNWIEQLTSHQPVRAFEDMMLAPVTIGQAVQVLMKVGQKKLPGIYQLSGEKDISYYELACYIASLLNLPATLIQSARAIENGVRKSFIPTFTTLDCSSIMTTFAERPPHYSEVIKECFEIS